MSRWGGGPSGWRQLEEIICDFVETIIDRPERSVFVKLSAKDYELIDKILKGNDLEKGSNYFAFVIEKTDQLVAQFMQAYVKEKMNPFSDVSREFIFEHYAAIKAKLGNKHLVILEHLEFANERIEFHRAFLDSSRLMQSSILEFKLERENNLIYKRLDACQHNLSDCEANLAEYTKNLNNSKLDIKDCQKKIYALSKVTKKIKQLEKDTMDSHIAILGVYSAIITIVMSIVVTSSSWLNNADGASAIFAFVIPSAIVILSIAVLFLFIFLYRKDIPYISEIQYSEKDMSESKDVKEEQETDEKYKNKEKQKVKIKIRKKCKNEKNIQKQENRKRMAIFIGVIILVSASITVLTYSALKYIMPSENSHQRYIIKQSQYSVTDEYDYEANCKRQYFEFNNEGKNHQFAFNEKFIHDGNLYYCDDHNRLE